MMWSTHSVVWFTFLGIQQWRDLSIFLLKCQTVLGGRKQLFNFYWFDLSRSFSIYSVERHLQVLLAILEYLILNQVKIFHNFEMWVIIYLLYELDGLL